MIPLIFINTPDSLLEESTITITDMKPIYNYTTRTLEVEFQYNLNDYFQIRVVLNEFDQPKYVYLKTNKTTEYEEVTRSKNEYTLDGNYVVAILTFDDIIKLVNNTLKATDVEKWEIKSKLFSQNKDSLIKMTQFEFNDEMEIISFIVNGNRFDYHQYENMPTLYMNRIKITPSFIYGNYYVFDVRFDDKDYQIAILHPKGFKNHYLFRQTFETHKMFIQDNVLTTALGDKYQYINGLISENGIKHSLQHFFKNVYNMEYIQYIFNIIRDNNLYTEIANAFNVVKHHSLMVYDLETDQRIVGKTNAKIILNRKGVPELKIWLKNTKDQFGNRYNHSIEARIPIVNILKTIEAKTPYKLNDYGYVLFDGEFLPLAQELVDVEHPGYVTGSNIKKFVSLSVDYLRYIVKEQFSMLIPVLRMIDDSVGLLPNYALKNIDYSKKTITLQNVYELDEMAFSDISNSEEILADGTEQIFSADGVNNLFGISLKTPPLKVEFNPVTPDVYYTYMLLIKHTEPYDYLMEDIERDCYYLSAVVKLTYMDREFAFVLNDKKDYLYYLDLKNQDSSRTLDGVESMSLYVDSVNEEKLKKMIRENCVKQYMVKDEGFGIDVDKDLNLFPYIVYNSLQSPVFSGKDGFFQTPKGVGFNTKTNQIAGAYKYSEKILVEKFRGIFGSYGVDVKNVSVVDGKVNISYLVDGQNRNIELSIQDGEYVYYDVLGERKTADGKSLGLDDSYGNVFYKKDEISGKYIAFDLNVIDYFIENDTVALNGEILFNDGNNVYIIRDNNSNSFSDSDVNTEFTNNSVICIESWYGNEIYGIISIEECFNKISYDGCFDLAKVSNDSKIYKLPFEAARIITVY